MELQILVQWKLDRGLRRPEAMVSSMVPRAYFVTDSAGTYRVVFTPEEWGRYEDDAVRKADAVAWLAAVLLLEA